MAPKNFGMLENPRDTLPPPTTSKGPQRGHHRGDSHPRW